MTNYIFLTKTEQEAREPKFYYAISENSIKKLNLFETYDNSGLLTGHTNSGDYAIENDYSNAKEDCLHEITKNFLNDKDKELLSEYVEFKNIQDYLNIEDDKIVIGKSLYTYLSSKADKINTFIENWRKENEVYTECEGFNYWDGHNWKSIIVKSDLDGWLEWEILNDEDLTLKLNHAIDKMEFIKEGFGTREYKYNNISILETAFADDFSSYQVTIEED